FTPGSWGFHSCADAIFLCIAAHHAGTKYSQFQSCRSILVDGLHSLGRFAARPGFATPRQTFVRRCQSLDARRRGPSADAITAALAPAGRTPSVLVGDSGRRLVGARYAVVATRRPAYGAPLARLSRLR